MTPDELASVYGEYLIALGHLDWKYREKVIAYDDACAHNQHVLLAEIDALRKERDTLAAENERLRGALAVAYDAIRAPIDDWKCILERKACDAIRAAIAKEPTT